MEAEDVSNFTGYVLIGGMSSRMGRDKSLLELDGEKLFERSASVLKGICNSNVYCVGGDGSARDSESSISFLADRHFDGKRTLRAPIIGLYTALLQTATPWVALLACDLPLVTGGVIARLADQCSNEVDAVVPIQPDGMPQPLCAFYGRERCLPVVVDMISEGDLKMQNLLRRINTRFVRFGEFADLLGSANFFLNVNKMEDYETARKICAAGSADIENA